MEGPTCGVCQRRVYTDQRGQRMNKSQLADEVYSLRGDIALMKLSALAQQVKFDRLLTAVQQLQEQVDLLNIERDRLEVAKW